MDSFERLWNRYKHSHGYHGNQQSNNEKEENFRWDNIKKMNDCV